MACGCIDRFSMTRRRTITTAVIRRAQMRAALDDLAWDFDIRLAGVVAALFASAARIFGNAARLRRVGIVLLRVPVERPFPDIADHVVHAVAIRRKRRHRRGPLKAIVI